MISTNINALIELVKKPLDVITEIKESIIAVFELYIEFCELFPEPFSALIKILIPTIIVIIILKLWRLIVW